MKTLQMTIGKHSQWAVVRYIVTLSGQSHIHTYQSMEGTTCVNLWHRGLSRCNEETRNQVAGLWGLSPVELCTPLPGEHSFILHLLWQITFQYTCICFFITPRRHNSARAQKGTGANQRDSVDVKSF